jgi:hypothetical protein
VSLLQPQQERDANAMHFALEPASSARLGFVFFMQLPMRARDEAFLFGLTIRKDEEKTPPPGGEKLFVHARLFHTHANEADAMCRGIFCHCGNLFDLP